MLSSFPFPSEDLRARARQLDYAAEIVRTATDSLPGPETRQGFAGPVRVVYDAEARRIQGLLVDAEAALVGATRHVHYLADVDSSGAGR